ncbi:MAG TPA: metallophosphoesterase [Aeromicrobium sp.]|nr:metallophosphoesterase [Aeromicrobium sp.]HKY58365.1 metallophosphoesterase [Aeromicrobium sp.]
MSLSDKIAATPPAPATHARRQEHPTGREFEWDGNAGFIRTEPLGERPKTWDEFIEDAGLDPAEVEVLEPVQVRGWDGLGRLEDGTTGIIRQHYYRLTVRRRVLKRDIDDLIKAAKRRSTSATPSPVTDRAFLVALGDLQLGKVDGDGVEGTVTRFLEKTTTAVARYRKIAKGAPIYLIHLGDCIEGFQSQGGANAWRTTLTTTEQVRLYRRLIIEQVKAFAGLGVPLTVVGIPGNHDEAHRPLHTYGDSWAIDAMAAVKDALDLAGNYEHVNVLCPARDELTLTLDMAGTIVGMAHGHQWRTGQATTWWAKQAHGRQPIGDADLLLSAHLHHLRIEQTGSDKTWIQTPALESGSQWWKHATGEWGQPGIVTAVVGGGSWSSLEVL